MKRFLVFAALFAWFGKDGHSQQTKVAPDCAIPFSFSASGAPLHAPTGNGYSNKVNQCGTWVISYQAPTGVTAISLDLQSASDTAGVPSTYGAFAGTAVTGLVSFGNASLPNAFGAIQGNPAWVRVLLTSASGAGTITGYAYGWIVPPQVYTAGSGAAPSANVTIVGPLGQAAMASSVPVVLANNQTAVPVSGFPATQDVNIKQVGAAAVPDGSVPTNSFCPLSAIINTSGSGDTQIVAASGSKVVYVCSLIFSSNGSSDVKLTTGTGSNCTTGLADLTGLFKSVSAFALDAGGALRGPAGAAVCFNQSVANVTGGSILYAQF